MSMENENRNGMNPDSNDIDHQADQTESVNFVMKDSPSASGQETAGRGAQTAGGPQGADRGAGAAPEGQMNQNTGYSGQTNRPPYQGPYHASQNTCYNDPDHSNGAYGRHPGGGSYSGNGGAGSYRQPSGYGGPGGNGYGNSGYSGPGAGGSQGNPDPRRKNGKKKGNLAKKAGMVTAAALLFGVISGGTIAGINVLSSSLMAARTAETAEEPTEATLQISDSTEAEATQPAQAAETTATMLDVSDIVDSVMPSMVAIHNTMEYQANSWFYGNYTYEVPSSGSGIIVGENDTELLMVTNNHVIEDSKELAVTFVDGTSAEAAIKGTDAAQDLAVIAVPLDSIPDDTKSKIKPATLGDSDSLKMGQGVVAIGNALGYGQTVTVGYISALNRTIQIDEAGNTRTVIQTDAAINPGNSGGALVNMKGEVIGINEAKTSATSVEGVGYAIPVSEVQDIIQDLMNSKTRIAVDESKQGYLGIQGTDVSERDSALYGMPTGVFVYKLVEGGAASQSDLKEKDIITKIDGQGIQSMNELKEMLTYYESGTTVTMTVQRLNNGQYEEKEVQIVLGTRPAEEETEAQGPSGQPR